MSLCRVSQFYSPFVNQSTCQVLAITLTTRTPARSGECVRVEQAGAFKLSCNYRNLFIFSVAFQVLILKTTSIARLYYNCEHM